MSVIIPRRLIPFFADTNAFLQGHHAPATSCCFLQMIPQHRVHPPQDDDWGTPGESKPSSGSKRRHEAAAAAAPDYAAAVEGVPKVSHEQAEAPAVTAAAPAAEAVAADEAPAEKRQKVRAVCVLTHVRLTHMA